MSKMTDDQENHLNRLANAFSVRVREKYEKGVLEHGGNLWDNPPEKILEFAMEEVEDLWVYLYTLKEQLHKSDTNLVSEGE